MENITLTPKQQKFCDEYLIDLNATQAALRAGYSGSTALNGNLMAIPKIRYYLQQRTQEVTQKARLTHEMVLTELTKIAFGNMVNYYHSDGTIKGMHELTSDEGAALWGLTVTESKTGTTTRIRLNSKLSALEKIAKHLKFYEAELAPPEKVYVYLNKETLDQHDKFDDELFDDEDDENEYFDEEDEAYYPWDTECKVAVAQARAACKERRGEVAVAVAGEEEEEEWEEEDEWEEEEDSSMAESAEVGKTEEAEPKRAGGVIDFGVKKPEEPKKASGRCEIPFMKAYSKEYEGIVVRG